MDGRGIDKEELEELQEEFDEEIDEELEREHRAWLDMFNKSRFPLL